MLRTLVVRQESLIRASCKQLAKQQATRCLSTQAARRVLLAHRSASVAPSSGRQPQAGVWPGVNWARGYSSLPSHQRVLLPALSPTMENGAIVSWEKKEGDKLNEGDLLAEIETDKATMGFETPDEGYLAKIVIAAGTKGVPIGQLVCIIVENEADVAAFKDFVDTDAPAAGGAAPAAPAPAAAAPAPAAPAAPTVVPVAIPPPVAAAPRPMTAVEQRGPRVYASPMAKRLAETQQLRLEGQGSGLYGSITSGDLGGLAAAGAAPAAAAGARAAAPAAGAGAYYDVPVSSIRAVIAKRLLESKVTIPHYYLSVDVNMDQIVKLRTKFNERLSKDGVKLSLNDFVIKATALASKAVPEANSAWHGSFIRMFDSVDLCVAVNTDKGLITPIIPQADRKGLVAINQQVKELALKARDGKLQPHEFQGGTITVSNLGMFGVTQFCAVINPPQSCILAVGGTQQRIIPDKSSEKGWKQSDFMTVTLSCDHRTVDGAVGAQWLQNFQRYMEDPHSMLL